MADMALYRKWRPTAFDEVVGQEHVIRTIQNALAAGRVAHAYLFSGPRGTGKTTTARLVAKALNCTHIDPHARPCNTCDNCLAFNEGRFLDLVEIDAASNTGVDNIRDLREKINFSPSEGVYKVYVIDECFRYEDLITLADGTKLPIGKVVEEKLPVEVSSYNETTGQIEAKPVLRWMKKRPKLPVVQIKFDNNRVVVCTMNHKFYTPGGMRHACELTVGQFVYANNERMSDHQAAVVAGAALGDGHISLTGSKMRARLLIAQGVAQKDYLDYKVQLLGDLVRTEPRYQSGSGTYSKLGTYRIATLSRSSIARLHRELYNAQGRKQITPLYLEKIDALGLALWYLDDGTLTTAKNPYRRKTDGGVSHYPATRASFSTHCFTLEEVHLIADWLKSKWGITGGVTSTGRGPVLWLTLDGTRRLHDLIAAFVPPSMAYKLLPEYRGRFCPPVDKNQPAELGVSIVKDIAWVEAPEYVYNIEVADNHNYFVRDILVANCHMLSMGAFNALLKTLEEPPAHAIFVLATTELHKVPLTVASRCQKHTFRRIPAVEVVARLQSIVRDEGLSVDPAVLEIVARQATGSLRDAISLLDQLVIAPDEPVTLQGALAVLGTASGQAVQDLVDALAEADSPAGLDLINTMIDQGADPRQFARQMVEYLRGLLLIRLGNAALVEATAGPETRKAMQAQAARLEPARLLQAIHAFNSAADARGGWIAQLPLELAFVESLRQPEPAAPQAAAIPAAPAPRRAAPPAAAPEAPAVSAAPAAGALPVGTLMAQWKQVVAVSKSHHPNLPPLLEKCTPLSVEGDVVTLGFQNDILMSKANDADRRAGIEKALAKVFGKTLRVKCVVNSTEVSLPPDVDSNGVVAEAVKLGGKLRRG